MEDNQQVLRSIGERIRQRREQLGINQAELAHLIGKTQTAISTYESGTRAIRVTELPELARVLETSVGYFFDEPINNQQTNKKLEPALSTILDTMQKSVGQNQYDLLSGKSFDADETPLIITQKSSLSNLRTQRLFGKEDPTIDPYPMTLRSQTDNKRLSTGMYEEGTPIKQLVISVDSQVEGIKGSSSYLIKAKLIIVTIDTNDVSRTNKAYTLLASLRPIKPSS